MTGISMHAKKYTDRRIKTNSIKKYIGQGLPKLTPVEIVGYEVDEAGSHWLKTMGSSLKGKLHREKTKNVENAGEGQKSGEKND